MPARLQLENLSARFEEKEQPFLPPDKEDAEMWEAVCAHVFGRATAAQVDLLEEDLHDWRRLLGHYDQSIVTRISEMPKEWQEKKNEYMSMGPNAKSQWFAWEETWLRRKGRLTAHRNKVTGAISIVKQMIRVESAESGGDSSKSMRVALDALRRKVQQLEDRVEELERG